jgi:outer membrane lipoprotein LolB
MRLQVDRRAIGCALWLAAAMVISGCATPIPDGTAARESVWAGRFSLTVHSEPPKSWSAGFELTGNPRSGQLQLSSPLGNWLAQVQWSPDGAEMQQGGRLTRHASLDRMAADLGEAPLPVTALFDWLEGRPSPVSGWEADLSRHAEGRIVARRRQPLPEAELRLIFQP